MTKCQEALLSKARSRVGSSFSHHFEPLDLCRGGRETLDTCMQRGLGTNNEYDCSGLVIASLMDVLGTTPQAWPRELRHVRQLQELEDRHTAASIGDILLFHPEDSCFGLHLGILAATMKVVHASGKTKDVTEGKVDGRFSRIGVIPTEKVLEIVLDRQRCDSADALLNE